MYSSDVYLLIVLMLRINMTQLSFTHWLNTHIQKLNARSGSIHYADSQDTLHLLASVNLPDSTLHMIQSIPYGKGMAGQAQKRLSPWSTCNLPQDPSSIIQPKARHVQAQGAIAYPLIHHLSDPHRCLGVVGFAFAHPLPSLESDDYQELVKKLEYCTQALTLSILQRFS